MVASLIYVRYFQSLERATWIFLSGSLIALGGSAAFSQDGYLISLIFLAVTPVKFGLILNWRQCLKFTGVLVTFYMILAAWMIGFQEADYMQAVLLLTFALAAFGAGLSTAAYAYRTKRASMHLERKNLEIARLALEDPLTGLSNRRAFNDLKNSDDFAEQSRLLAVIDLDNFKGINDQFGHDVGDEVLVELANRLNKICRKEDLVFRFGGDEFAVVAGSEHALPKILGSRICAITDADIKTSAGPIKLSLSVGISRTGAGKTDPDQLFREADIASYGAKQRQGSCWVVYETELRPKHERADKVSKLLRAAIDAADLDVEFQPQFQIHPRTIVGFEALARWNSKELGTISPAEFIPAAEASNTIVELDRVVFTKALNIAQKWLRSDQVLSLNISGATLLSGDFLRFAQRAIANTRLSFHQVQIEITETQILANRDEAIAVCDELRNLGFSIALDDFGTGFCSLSYLSNLPVNVLKVDRSFVQGCDRPSNQKIMRSIVGLAHSLGLCIMIEGVERDWQLDIVEELGCNFVQGFYFSRPLTDEKCAQANNSDSNARVGSYLSDLDTVTFHPARYRKRPNERAR